MKLFALTAALILSSTAWSAAKVGEKAPDFTLTASDGSKVTLSQLAGKTVVLEWLNHECPFVVKHYGTGNMQKLQKTYTDKGVVWLSVNSSAEGKEGYSDAKHTQELSKEHKSKATHVLIDSAGTVGKLYGSKTTPHMYVIDAKGTLVYNGAIDDKASTKDADVATAKNYVSAALDETLAGKPITVSTSKPYGCGVKYAN